MSFPIPGSPGATPAPSDTSADSIPVSIGSASRARAISWFVGRVVSAAIVLGTAAALIALVGLAQRVGWIRVEGEGHSEIGGGGGPAETAAEFTCPMHPQIRQPRKGRCPICGMELVPASASSTDIDAFAVRVEPAQRRLANIRTAPAESGPIDDAVDTVGTIAIDESRQSTIAAYVDGRVERLFADYTGVPIQQGDHLAIVYSPQLFAAQVEYLEARRTLQAAESLPAVRAARESLAANTRRRLREYGMTEDQVAELERAGQAESRLTIHSPRTGTVVEKLVVEGGYLKSGDPIYRVAELSTVWLMLQLFPEDAARVRFGQRVETRVQSLPGKTLVGRVAFINPTVDRDTRTVGVRVELRNDDGRLRPGDYATARVDLPIGPQGQVYDADLAGKWISPMHPQVIQNEPGKCPICGMDLIPTSRFGYAERPVPRPMSLHVPRSAVLLAGIHSVVYVETEPGRFEIRPVSVGPILRDRIVVLDGLNRGEQVATAGNFLIDSQMQLAGKPSLFDPSRALANASESKPQGPLRAEEGERIRLGGSAGESLESLFSAYFEIHAALASDQLPPESAQRALRASAGALAANPSLASLVPAFASESILEIASRADGWNDLDLKNARESFKAISRAAIRIASRVRGDSSQDPFTHYYCPMVRGGGGDWLQRSGTLSNPYFGSEMPRCGEKVRTYPPDDDATSRPNPTRSEPSGSPVGEGR